MVKQCLNLMLVPMLQDAWVKPEQRPSREWPSDGAVDFLRYSTRYRPELPLVLQDVSFDIKSGEKVSVFGSTFG